MTYAIIAAGFACVVFLGWLHGRSLERLTALSDQRLDRLVAFQQVDRDKWAAQRAELMSTFAEERYAWERERGTLLNRIKPETRQYVPARINDTPDMPQPIPYDDDDAFAIEVESREELAERLAAEERNGRR